MHVFSSKLSYLPFIHRDYIGDRRTELRVTRSRSPRRAAPSQYYNSRCYKPQTTKIMNPGYGWVFGGAPSLSNLSSPLPVARTKKLSVDRMPGSVSHGHLRRARVASLPSAA